MHLASQDQEAGRQAEPPDATAVQAAMERLKNREPFASAPQLTSFLTYVVNETLAGRGHELKGYSIATLALGRPESFDPQIDPIVRVQAGRLRQALAEYDQAHQDDILIALPKGSYVPSFAQRKPVVALASASALVSTEGNQTPHQPVRHTDQRVVSKRTKTIHRRLFWTAASTAFLAISATLIGLYASGILGRQGAPVAYTPPSIFPEIVVDETFSGLGAQDAAVLAERLRDAIARFDDIVAVRDQTDPSGHSTLLAPRRLAEQLRLRLFVTDANPGFNRVSVRLVDQLDQSVVWSHEFQPIAAGVWGDEARSKIIRHIATTVAQPYGVIHGYTRSKAPRSVFSDTPYQCLLTNFEYQLERNRSKHQAAMACVEDNLKRFPGVAALHSNHANLLGDAYRFGYPPTSAGVLNTAIASARLGVRLAPASARANQSLFTILHLRNEVAASWRAGSKARELNPYDVDIQADYGHRLILSGQISAGIEMIDDALAFSPSPSPTIVMAKAFGLHMQGKRDDAMFLSDSSQWSSFPLAVLARVVIARLRNDKDEANVGLKILREQFPSILNDVKGYLQRSNVELGMASRADAQFSEARSWVEKQGSQSNRPF